MATVLVPCHVNGLIASNETHFVPWKKCRAVSCRVNDPLSIDKHGASPINDGFRILTHFVI